MPDVTSIQGNSTLRMLRLLTLMPAWYFRDHPVRILQTYVDYAGAFRESFSMLFLLKTLFSPWKSITDSYPRKGFNIQAILEAFFLNLTTRGIGAFIRLSAIIAGIFIQVGLLAGFLAYSAWWIVFPFVLVLLPFYLVFSFFQ